MILNPILNPQQAQAVITPEGHHVIINSDPALPIRRPDGTLVKVGDYHIDTALDDHYSVWKCTSLTDGGTRPRWSDITTGDGLHLTYTDYHDLLDSLHPNRRHIHDVIDSEHGRKKL